MATVFINELHYDNDGNDVGELIEIAGPAGTDLTGWQIVRYNGSGGAPYTTPAAVETLSGTLADAGDGFGFITVTYPANGLQNGSPDAVALVDATGAVVQFLSYEGSFTAVGGPADGLTSTDIGVAETSTTPAGFSLQLTGTGTTSADFAWAAPADDTPGAVNNGEVFGEPPPPPPTVAIYDIQGAGHSSALVGDRVTTTGIVTATDSNGFYIQDPDGDGDDATSDGLFVFTGSTPTVAIGDGVSVVGTVGEFLPGGNANNLTVTQLSGSPVVTVLSSGNPLPGVTIGEGGLTPPTEIIDDDQLAVFDPEEDGIDFYESVEGMRVTLQDATVTGTLNGFGEFFAVSDAPATGLNERGGITISEGDFNPEWLQIDVDTGVLDIDEPEPDIGDRLGDVTGVVSYNFGDFELVPTEAITVTPDAPAPETTDLAGDADRLLVASYNVENLDPGDGGRFAAIAQQIVNNLNAPDVIALQEVQDNDGATNSDETSADQTLQLLVDAIAAAGGPAYQFVDNPFIGDDTNGGEPGGNIRTAFLYDPSRVDLVGSDGNIRTVVDPQDQQTNPENPFFASRLPLAIDVAFNGQVLTLVDNHFSSKGGSTELYGAVQPPINGSVEQREAQAAAVNDFVTELLAGDAGADAIVLGDINEFQFFGPLETLESGGDATQELFNTTFGLEETDRYSFIFEGNSQSLDHILATGGLFEDAEVDAVHINAEFADRVTDHDPRLALFDLTPEVEVASLRLSPLLPILSYREDGDAPELIRAPFGQDLPAAADALPIVLSATEDGAAAAFRNGALTGLGIFGAGDNGIERRFVEGEESIGVAIAEDASFDVAYSAEIDLSQAFGTRTVSVEALVDDEVVAAETFSVAALGAEIDFDPGVVFDSLRLSAADGTSTSFGFRAVSLHATDDILVA